jgi:rhodanese-related sulfurtransferase
MASRRIFLFLAPVSLAAAAVGYPLLFPAFAGPTLDPATAFQRAEAGEIVLIDIRRPDEWQATGTGKGAHPIDLRRPDFVEALSTLVEGDRSRPIALICARGVRSARLANQLTENGFSNVINIPEGMLGSSDGPGWIGRGLPVVAN